jgi:hypothetical protein
LNLLQEIVLEPSHFYSIDQDEHDFWLGHFFVPNVGGLVEQVDSHHTETHVVEEQDVQEENRDVAADDPSGHIDCRLLVPGEDREFQILLFLVRNEEVGAVVVAALDTQTPFLLDEFLDSRFFEFFEFEIRIEDIDLG